LIEQSLAALAASRTQVLQVGAAESALLVALKTQFLRKDMQRAAVRSMLAGDPPAVADGTFAAVVHRADFLRGHLQPYIDLLDALDGLEATLSDAQIAHMDMLKKLSESLSVCSVTFQFVDNTAGSPGRAAAMSADFWDVVERPELKQEQLIVPRKDAKKVGLGQVLWDYASGRTGQAYAPDAQYRRHEKAIGDKRDKHLAALRAGDVDYSALGGSAGADAGGFLTRDGRQREGSSWLFAWLRAHETARALLGLVIVAVAVGGALYIQKLRRRQAEQLSKKRV